MTSPDILKRDITTLAFDQYGTIVDIQGGLTEAVGRTRPNSPSAKFLCRKFGGQPMAAPRAQDSAKVGEDAVAA